MSRAHPPKPPSTKTGCWASSERYVSSAIPGIAPLYPSTLPPRTIRARMSASMAVAHCSQAFCPFVLLRFLRRELHSLFLSKACAVQGKEDEVSSRLVVCRECCKFVRRHPDMHRPREVVCHDHGASRPRKVPVTACQLGQEPGEAVLPQIPAVGQTGSGSGQVQRNLGHGVAPIFVAQPEDSQVGALRNRSPARGECLRLRWGPRRSSSQSVKVCTRTPGAISLKSRSSSAAIRGSGYTIA